MENYQVLHISFRGEWNDLDIKELTFEFSLDTDDSLTVIGKSKVYIIDEAFSDDLFYTFDYADDLIHAFFALFIEGVSEGDFEEDYHKETVYINTTGNTVFAYIKDFEIYKPFRNRGYGKEMFQALLENLNKEKVNYVFLRPLPYKKEGETFVRGSKEEQDRLINFYQSFGFEPSIGKMDEIHMAMVLSLYDPQ